MRWSPALSRLGSLVGRPIAHRGLHDSGKGVVENSAAAFGHAIAHDYAIECDLQLSADGEAMVFHDEELDRLMESSGPLRARTARALRRIAFKRGRDRIQTLGDLLDQVAGKVTLVIELKSHWDGDDALLRRALEVLAPYSGRYSLMSFDPDIVAAIREMSPATLRGIVTDRTTDHFYDRLSLGRRLELRYSTHMWRTQPHFISYRWSDLPFTPVSLFREAGHPVICWTIRSPDTAAWASRYADQITFEGFLP
jgi:glycerophosphoryl diester phosphodiesterase